MKLRLYKPARRGRLLLLFGLLGLGILTGLVAHRKITAKPRQAQATSAAQPLILTRSTVPAQLNRRGAPPARISGRPGIGSAGTYGKTSLSPPILALVIDDIGHNLDYPRRLLDLGVPLTFSILPRLPHTRDAARMIQRAGGEFILHIPMEPLGFPQADPGPGALFLRSGFEETRRRLSGFLDDLPGAVGASNHMGSAYTQNRHRMQWVQTVLADRQLLFLNSKTVASPVPAKVAAEGGYAYLERDVFLDHDPREKQVLSQLNRAARKARNTGRAIAIGHPLPGTLRVLEKHILHNEFQGVKLVRLTQLAEASNRH